MEENLPVSLNRYSVVVIPAYEPSPGLIPLVETLAKADYRVIVVDDGSGDSFGHIWDELDERTVLMHHTHNEGKGAALKTAFKYISDWMPDAGCIITMDADGQHLVEDMEHVAQCAWLNPGALVLGSRSFDGEVPLRSRLGNTITRWVFSAASRARVRDTQTGLRAFNFSLLDYMLQTEGSRYEYEMNMLLHCHRNGIPVVEIPIKTVYLDRENSSSHFHPFRDSIKILKTIFKFASSSLASFALDYVLFMALAAVTRRFQYGILLSNVIARLGSGTFNYLLNRNLVFKDQQNARKTFLGYLLLATGILLANNVVLSFYTYMLGISVWLAKILTEVTLFLISLTVQTTLIFKKDTHHKSQKTEVKKYDSDTSRKAV